MHKGLVDDECWSWGAVNMNSKGLAHSCCKAQASSRLFTELLWDCLVYEICHQTEHASVAEWMNSYTNVASLCKVASIFSYNF